MGDAYVKERKLKEQLLTDLELTMPDGLKKMQSLAQDRR